MLYYNMMKDIMVLYQIFKKEVMAEVIGEKVFTILSGTYFKKLKNFKEVV